MSQIDADAGAERPRFCSNCGGQISDGTSFCGSCGTPVVVSPAPKVGPVLNHGSPAPALTPDGTTTTRRPWLIITAAVIVLLVAGGATAFAVNHGHAPTARKTTTQRSMPHLQSVALPVRECPTTQGIQSTLPSLFPSSITASLDSSVAKALSYYSDSTRSVAPILGPAGWSCNVVEAVDGGITISVFPPSESADFTSQDSSVQPFTASKDEAVVAVSGGACQGCVAGLACPLISYVGNQTGETAPCPNTQPAAETVKWLNGSPTLGSATVADDTVSFQDPPGVAGDGAPSGGRYRADGIVHYTYNGEGSSSVITCTLPSSRIDLCPSVLSDFSTRNWPSAGAATTPATSQVPVTTPSPPTSTVPSSATQPSCSDSALFPLVAQAEPSVAPTDVPISTTPISAYCSDGWAVLLHFTVQAGSGNGIALFQQAGDSWQFIQLGDDSGDGPHCEQYPAAAMQALGGQLCG
jgi:hypothetical protein